jgi:chromosome segregation ATPase
MNNAVFAFLVIHIISLQAIAPRVVTQRRTEFAQIIKSATPDTARAQAIIAELRAAKEERIALELERDLQALLAQQQPLTTEIVQAEPTVITVPAEPSPELDALKQQLAQKEQAFAAIQSELAAAQEELATLKTEVTQAKEAAETAGAELTRKQTELDASRKEIHDSAHQLKQLSLQLLDHINNSNALLGQAQIAARDNHQIAGALEQIGRRFDAMSGMRDDLLNITLPA